MAQASASIGNHGSGPQNAAGGSGSQNNQNGPGPQYNITNHHYHGQLTEDDGVLYSEEEVCRRSLRSLDFPALDARQREIAIAHPETCDWLFETSQFCKWRNQTDLVSHNGVLLIRGKPGVGKSTLMKHALHYCKETLTDHLIVTYFFNARGEILEKTALGMLRSFVYQLVQADRDILDRFILHFRLKQRTFEAGKPEWRLADLRDFLVSEIRQQHSKPIVLLVDALDECNEPDVREVVSVLEHLSVIAAWSRTVLKMCLSSRHYPAVSMKRKLEVIVESKYEHQEDLARYVTDKLHMQDEVIIMEIQRKADGVFLWAVLVVAMLNDDYLKGRIEGIRGRLDELPKVIEELFDNILAKDDKQRAETVLVLQWLLFSPRPMEPEQLFFAVMTMAAPQLMGPWDDSKINEDIIRNRITDSSKGLVEVRSGCHTEVYFIHKSVNDFLLRKQRLRKLDPTLGLDPERASNSRLWSWCWQWIEHVYIPQMDDDTYRYEQMKGRWPFLAHALEFVFHYAEEALSDDDSCQEQHNGNFKHCKFDPPDSFLSEECCKIVRWTKDIESNWFRRWNVLMDDSDRLEHGTHRIAVMADAEASLLYILSLNGYKRLVRIALTIPGIKVDEQGGKYGTALQAASKEGYAEVVKLLLDAGAEVNKQGGVYGDALQAASVQGSHEVVRLLLDAGAEVNKQGGVYGNALSAASLGGSKAVVKLLLDVGAEVNIQDGHYGNALQAASECPSQEVVKLLLDAKADVNRQAGPYSAHRTALQAASYKGSRGVVEQLLSAGADVNAPGGEYGSALQAALSIPEHDITPGHHAVAKLLIEHGATYGDSQSDSDTQSISE